MELVEVPEEEISSAVLGRMSARITQTHFKCDFNSVHFWCAGALFYTILLKLHALVLFVCGAMKARGAQSKNIFIRRTLQAHSQTRNEANKNLKR